MAAFGWLWLASYKRGVLALAQLDWLTAMGAFTEPLQVYRNVGRRSMVPFVAMHAALAAMAANEAPSPDAKAEARGGGKGAGGGGGGSFID